MSGPIYFDGIIDLKEGVTLPDIIQLYVDEGCAWRSAVAQLEALEADAEGEFSDYDDEVTLKVEGDQLSYHVDMSDGSYSFADDFEDFLKEMQSRATSGWCSYEGEPGDQQVRVYYGPDAISKAQAELEVIAATLAQAVKDYGIVYARFMKTVADEATK